MQSNFEAIHIKKARLTLEKNLKIAKEIKEESIKSKQTLTWWQKIKEKFLG